MLRKRLTAIIIVIIFAISQLNLTYFQAFAVSNNKIKPSIQNLKSSYSEKEKISFLVNAKGYTKDIQYRISLFNTSTKKTINITKGYTSKYKASSNVKFALPGLKKGKYRVIVYARQYGLKVNYNAYIAKNLTISAYINNVKPTTKPTESEEPTIEPTEEPTEAPTAAPTTAPTEKPTAVPTVQPTIAPTPVPTVEPTVQPTAAPTTAPTLEPTAAPTTAPIVTPTTVPTVTPTQTPTAAKLAITSISANLSSGVINVTGISSSLTYNLDLSSYPDSTTFISVEITASKDSVLTIKGRNFQMTANTPKVLTLNDFGLPSMSLGAARFVYNSYNLTASLKDSEGEQINATITIKFNK